MKRVLLGLLSVLLLSSCNGDKPMSYDDFILEAQDRARVTASQSFVAMPYYIGSEDKYDFYVIEVPLDKRTYKVTQESLPPMERFPRNSDKR